MIDISPGVHVQFQACSMHRTNTAVAGGEVGWSSACRSCNASVESSGVSPGVLAIHYPRRRAEGPSSFNRGAEWPRRHTW